MRGQDDNIDPAVLGTSLRSEIAGYRMILSVACGRKPFWREAMADNEEANQFGGSIRRKLPIRVDLRGVNWNVVCMPFDAQLVGADGQDGSDAIDCREGLRFNRCRSATEETELP